MAKMDFSKFDEGNVSDAAEGAVIPAGRVEVVPSQTIIEIAATGENSGTGISGIGAISGDKLAAIIGVVNTLLNAVSTIGKCVAAVKVEKEKTRQVEAQAKAQITEAKQQTARVKIHEKEETKRVKMECETKLEGMELELTQMEKELNFKTKQATMSHVEYMATLERLGIIVDEVIRGKEAIRKLLLESDGEDREERFKDLRQADEKLVQLAEQIVVLRGVR